MATELLVIPEKQHLAMVTPYDMELLGELRDGKQYKAKLTLASQRSVEQNRYYWGGVLQTAVENQEYYAATKPLHIWIKTRLGYIDRVIFHDDSVHVEVESTSFGKMPPDEFKTYLDAAIILICTDVIPGLDPDLLKADATRRTGVSYRQVTGAAA